MAGVPIAGSASIIASMMGRRPFRADGSRWIFFRAGGSAEVSARATVRRPTCRVLMMVRRLRPFSASRRIAAYFSRWAARFRSTSSRG
jgi:hypothetical protein